MPIRETTRRRNTQGPCLWRPEQRRGRLCGRRMQVPAQHASQHASQAGMSLVELMVALALGAFVTVGIIQVFTASQQTYGVTVAQARMQENARFAMYFLSNALRSAGYTGCFSNTLRFEANGGQGTTIHNVLHPVAGTTNVPYSYDLGEAVLGHNGTGSGWTPALSTLTPLDTTSLTVTSATDVLVVRTVESAARVTQTMPHNEADITIKLPDNTDLYDTDSILLVGDCEKATVFQSTGTTTTADEMTISHAVRSTASLGNEQLALTDDRSHAYGTDSAVYTVSTQIFFIADGTDTDPDNNAIPSLWRQINDNPPAELVQGIQDMEIWYGIDTDNSPPDQVPNQYSSDPRNPPGTVVTVRIWLESVSPVVSTERQDLVRGFTSTIALRNML